MRLVWLLWFIASLGAFVALEARAVWSPAPGDTLSANVKRLTRRLSQPERAAFILIFVGGAAVLSAHWLGLVW